MATKLTQSRTATFDITLQRGTEQKTRRISFDSYNTTGDSTDIQTAMSNIAQSLVGGYNTFIQPTQWRDSDNTEEEWKTIAVKPVLTDSTQIELDEVIPTPTTEKKINP